jgi:tetratricopeptide (TPR) repeat protein
MFVVFLLFLSSAAAQFGSRNIVRRVRVQVSFANGPCEISAHVTLMGLNGPIHDGIVDDQCRVDFSNVPEGNYRVGLSGGSSANADLGSIEIMAGGSDEFEVQVKRQNEPDRNAGMAAAFVSAADLSIPSRARKELDKANELAGKQDLTGAIQRLNKAIAIYPTYALAYNNLGVIYSRLQDQVREREALQKAVSLNDHLALAYVNLGRMDMVAGDLPDAEIALVKASALDPTDAMALILLSYANFMDRKFDDAIAASHKAHALNKPHAFAHRVAARAFEQQKQGANAAAELELFLKEEPPGPRADAARKELEVVKAVLP